MATLTFFTARHYLKSVVADEDDVDVDPEIKGIYGGVTITPLAGNLKTLQATTLVPPASIVLAPIDARLDDGRLQLNADQPDVRLVAQTAVLELPTGTDLLYQFEYDHVTYNGKPQMLPSFKIAAPTADVIVDLASWPRVT